METLPKEIQALIFERLCLRDLVVARRVSVAFRKAIASLAPLERIPSLLHRQMFTAYIPIEETEFKQPRWRKCGFETLKLKEKIPALSRCESAFGSGWSAFAGRMNDTVWNSHLVQWLRKRNELDLLPWKEMILLRVAQNQCDIGWHVNQVVKPERLGRDEAHDEDNDQHGGSPLLPTKIVVTDRANGETETKAIPFRLETWRDAIISLNPESRTWKDKVKQAIENRRKDEYTDSDSEWEGSTTTSEGRMEWAPWVILQTDQLLKELAQKHGLDEQQACPQLWRWSGSHSSKLLKPEIEQRSWELNEKHGILVVQMANHIFFLLW